MAIKFYKHKNYKSYKKAQQKTNKRKLGHIWAVDEEIKVISHYIKEHIPDVNFGICHGVRNGWEVKQFRQRLGIEVIGTEISNTANNFKNVINWDFHKIKPEWIGNVGFIYSNSLDHSYDPDYCIDQWMGCLRTSGRCFVEWSESHNCAPQLDETDCFEASFKEYKQLFENKYCIEYVINIECWNKRSIFVIKHLDG